MDNENNRCLQPLALSPDPLAPRVPEGSLAHTWHKGFMR